MPFYPTVAMDKDGQPDENSKLTVNKIDVICRKVVDAAECISYQLEIVRHKSGGAVSCGY